MHTLGYYALALSAQGAEPAAGAGEVNTDIVYLVTHGGLVPQVVLLILLIFSAVSWGIVLTKFWQFSRSTRQSSTFIDIFRKSSKFSEVQAGCRTLGRSPRAGQFQAGDTPPNAPPARGRDGQHRRPANGALRSGPWANPLRLHCRLQVPTCLSLHPWRGRSHPRRLDHEHCSQGGV